jgi:GNAT superfamily N-acetyltransferase
MTKLDIIQVDNDCVDKTGFFCRMSKMKTEGNQRKLRWAHARFDEGMRMSLLGDGERGFVEVLPGEHAWRPVEAAQWDVIHCLWVVGKSKGKGNGDELLRIAIDGAKEAGQKGICTVTRDDKWVTPRSFYEEHGFEVVDEANDPNGFVLLAKKLRPSKATPRFSTHDWQSRLKDHKKGLTVFRADQCPYIDDATATARAVAKKLKIPFTEVEFSSAADIRARAPSPYGVFGMALDGKWLSYCYQLPKDLERMLKEV